MENQNQHQEQFNNTPPTNGGGSPPFINNEEDEKNLKKQAVAEDELSKALALERQVPAPSVPQNSTTPAPKQRPASYFQIRKPGQEMAPKPAEPDAMPESPVMNSPFSKKNTQKSEHSIAEHMLQEKPTTSGTAPAPKPASTPTQPVAKPPVKTGFVPNPKLKTLRTFHGDMAEIVRNKGESVASIAVAAQKKKEEDIKPKPVTLAPTPHEHAAPLARLAAKKYPHTTPLPHSVPKQAWHAPTPPAPHTFGSTPFRKTTQQSGPAHHATMPAITRVNPSKNEVIPVKAAAHIPFFRNTFFVLASLALLGIGGFTIYSIFFAKSFRDRPVEINQPNTLVAYDTYTPVAFDAKGALVSYITNLKGSLPADPASVVYAYIDTDPEPLMTRLTPRIPQVLSRILEKPYAIGFYRDGTEGVFFTAFTVESFGQALSGMLAWEDELYESFKDIHSNPNAEIKTGFVDAIVENKDVRKLVGADGKTVLVYGFIDDNTLIITENEATFRGIANNILIKRSTR